MVFNLNLPMSDSLLMAAVAFEGFFMLLIYIRIIVFKTYQMTSTSISVIGRRNHSRFGTEQANGGFYLK
jgi:hypothetical protein